jgi:transposase
MSHRNAPLTPAGRLLMVERVAAGTPQAHVAAQMGLSRGTVAKWWHRFNEFGEAGLEDRSSRPHRSPNRTPAKVEERICRLRRSTKRGPQYLAWRTGVPSSTVWRILRRNGLNRLAWMDRPTGQVIGRYERAHPGELVHLDIKKVGKIPPGGDGASTAEPRPSAGRSGTRTCTWRSMTTAGSL